MVGKEEEEEVEEVEEGVRNVVGKKGIVSES